MVGYAELQVTSNFSFLRGGSRPEELALAGKALGLAALSVVDRNSLAGVVRAHCACKTVGLRFLVGARLDLEDGPSLLVWPSDRAAYGRLSRLITRGRLRAPKGECRLRVADLQEAAPGQWAAVVAEGAVDAAFAARVADYRALFGRRLSLAASHLYRGDDARRLARLAALGRRLRVPLLATNDVHYHTPARRPLQDVLTCIREHCTIDTAGWRLAANAERHLKPPAEMARLFRGYPEALERGLEIAAGCDVSLDTLKRDDHYPDEVLTDAETPQQSLERLTWEGAARRYGDAVPESVAAQLRHELALIARLHYARFFLTVHEIVRFANERKILCQGRGSAANSAVCYVLGITAVDPQLSISLFERFVSEERQEPPDIDVDFEHERREEVIQHIYEKYGRDHAGMTATFICYRGRGAIRDVGKAMGLSADLIARLSATLWGWGQGVDADRAREAGLDLADPRLAQTLALAAEIRGFPRHLSQHVGGFLISRGPLSELVPVENATMKDRTVIEWDKDDLDRVGLLKVDVLGLGMLSCIRRAFDLLDRHYGLRLTLQDVPKEDKRVYEMLSRADSLGVFQVESRAQMTMLPRLRPKTFYDLVIEVAIVRPGPIQGDMVHPYLRRRNGEEPIPDYATGELKAVLEKTLGVPLFQEQAMKIAIVGAGFSPGEADQLRRAMATFKKNGDLRSLRDRFIRGMKDNGYPLEFAERCFSQIEGFGNYGFPESHAASFAILVYISAWIKYHYPDVFAAALLNSQPMGFYAPAQIVRDAREHGVEVRPPDVNRSLWDCTLEALEGGRHAVRLGLRQVKGFAETEAEALVAARGRAGPFRTVRALWAASGLPPAVLDRLARADAFRSLGLDRRQAGWAVKGLGGAVPLPLFAALAEEAAEPAVALPAMRLGEHVVADYTSIAMTLKQHPLALLRAGLAAAGFAPCRRLAELRHGQRAAVAGLVLVRQRPGTASGIIFVTLEDEGGVANLVVLPPVIEAFRRPLLASRLMGAAGRVERVGEVIHLKVDRITDLSDRLSALDAEPRPADPPLLQRARNFH